jgi:hypothetical protein
MLPGSLRATAAAPGSDRVIKSLCSGHHFAPPFREREASSYHHAWIECDFRTHAARKPATGSRCRPSSHLAEFIGPGVAIARLHGRPRREVSISLFARDLAVTSRAIGLNILPIGAAQPPAPPCGHCSTIATLCAPPQMPAITKQAGAECNDDVRVRPRAIDRKRSEPDWRDAGAPTQPGVPGWHPKEPILQTPANVNRSQHRAFAPTQSPLFDQSHYPRPGANIMTTLHHAEAPTPS